MDSAGTRIGPYSLCARIASGGFGSVHLARRGGAMGFSRIFAAKVVRETRAGDCDAMAMFIDEARISSRITHPNVVPVLDVVEADDRFWLIMDYVEGQSLGALLAREDASPLPAPIALAIACGILRGLHAAHEATDGQGRALGIVHRDVSPHNVIISVHGVVKVVDFGIAKATGRLSVTFAGQVKGKLAYMAPEQQGSATVDRRADLYALAVLLWEMLVGGRMSQVRDPARLAASIPGASLELREIVQKNLAPSAHDRHASAAEMADALERCDRLASERELAAWLESWAGEALRERRELVQAIERDLDARTEETNDAPAGVTVEAEPERAIAGATESALVVGAERNAPPDPDSAPVPESAALPSASSSSAARRPMRAWLAVGFLGGVTAVLVAVAASTFTAPAPRATLEKALPRVVLAAHVVDSSPAPRAPPTNVPDDARPADPVMSNVPVAAPGPRNVTSVRSSRPPAQLPPAIDCDPPYVIDARGVKVLRPECMH